MQKITFKYKEAIAKEFPDAVFIEDEGLERMEFLEVHIQDSEFCFMTDGHNCGMKLITGDEIPFDDTPDRVVNSPKQAVEFIREMI